MRSMTPGNFSGVVVGGPGWKGKGALLVIACNMGLLLNSDENDSSRKDAGVPNAIVSGGWLW